MAIFLQEDNKELNKKTYHLSRQGKDTLNSVIAQMEAYGLEKSDGYKLLKHLQDEDYNQGKENEKDKMVKDPNVHTEKDKDEDKGGKGIINKTVEGGIHRNKVSKDKIMHICTDWVYGRNGELTLKHKAAQTAANNKPTLPLKPKKPTVPQPKKMKPLKANNGSEIMIKN